jgi:outer membrane protein assembly factor BamA
MLLAKSAVVCFCLALSAGPAVAQSHSQLPAPAARYPYAFTNFVWWSDADLRAELKRRIPGLGPEIAPDSREESRIRTVLELLLKQKGIQTEVQSMEPSTHVYYGARDPNAPPPSIQFSILAPPEIVVESLVIENGPPEVREGLSQEANSLQGRPYATTSFWLIKEKAKDALQGVGYLTANVEIAPGQPKKVGERYVVKVIASITSGPKFHVANVSGDGGPLLQGRDLSLYFALKAGDVATSNAFGRLVNSLRSVYWHAGYADVAFEGPPVIDIAHALASYQLKVIPGPVYHVRSIEIEGLAPEQKEVARRMFGLKTGDVYDQLSITKTSEEVSREAPSLKGYGFSYNEHADKQSHVVDLTLKFYKE